MQKREAGETVYSVERVTIICAISTLFVNNVGFYFLTLMTEFWVLKKIGQHYLTIKYRSG